MRRPAREDGGDGTAGRPGASSWLCAKRGSVPIRPPVLRTGLIRAMLNFEIAEHPVSDSSIRPSDSWRTPGNSWRNRGGRRERGTDRPDLLKKMVEAPGVATS